MSPELLMHPELDACPKIIRNAIQALARDAKTQSIWLIGSRANFRARVASDWDVLAFREDKPRRVSQRCNGLDVIHVGPSGEAMLEGVSLIISFRSFSWSRISAGVARYVGCDFEAGAPIDRPQLRALLLYEKRSDQAPEDAKLKIQPRIHNCERPSPHAHISMNPTCSSRGG